MSLPPVHQSGAAAASSNAPGGQTRVRDAERMPCLVAPLRDFTPRGPRAPGDFALARDRPRLMRVKTSRGAVVDTRAVIGSLKPGRPGSLVIDADEEQGDLFFRDLSAQVITDDVFARLLALPNVLLTAHHAFFTHEAVRNIAETAIKNIKDSARGRAGAENRVTAANMVR